MNVPVYRMDAAAADQAFAAKRALDMAVRNDPELASNPYFKALRDTASARFRAAFERV